MELSFSFIYMIIFSVTILYILSKFLFRPKPKFGKNAPSPFRLPIVGHLHLLAKYPDEPWKGFEEIREKFGDVVALKLGIFDTIMVSSFETIKEVLITKGKFFLNRPDFYRFELMFGGDREKALPLCDWSEKHKNTRSFCLMATAPNPLSSSFERLDKVITSEMESLLKFIGSSDKILTKCWTGQITTNIFTQYLCGSRLEYGDPELIIQSYRSDYTLYDISASNTPIDFLPWLKSLGFYRESLDKLKSTTAQKWVDDFLVKPRIAQLEKTREEGMEDLDGNDSKMFLDQMLEYYYENPKEFCYSHVVYSLSDLIGASSAISNLIMNIIGHLAMDEEVQEEIYQQIEATARQHKIDTITLKHRPHIPLVDSCVLEALRFSSSPIVPHVSTEDTTIGGYFVPKGTMIYFNNWPLNFSTKRYTKPEQFIPSRFVCPSDDNNNKTMQLKKPEVLIPFSIGQRTCLGFKMTRYISFSFMSNLLLRYKIAPEDSVETITDHIKIGVLALRTDDCFRVKLIPRAKQQ
ncbi:cytochrome P450 307a1-like [Panonychus citri]|uniref:cytochrome P450 307a1-like n=1 Tax=Panonychus citri TaxID=50023 RepID=UPI0023082D72|nr:cytochrome P450 307a1-like [Panonychus citri]